MMNEESKSSINDSTAQHNSFMLPNFQKKKTSQQVSLKRTLPTLKKAPPPNQTQDYLNSEVSEEVLRNAKLKNFSKGLTNILCTKNSN